MCLVRLVALKEGFVLLLTTNFPLPLSKTIFSSLPSVFLATQIQVPQSLLVILCKVNVALEIPLAWTSPSLYHFTCTGVRPLAAQSRITVSPMLRSPGKDTWVIFAGFEETADQSFS